MDNYGQPFLGQVQGEGYPPPPMDMGGMTPAQMLTNVQKLSVKQKVSLLEAAGDTAGGTCPCIEMCLERENEYDVFDEHTGQKMFYVKEDSSFCCRCCCNPYHELKLNIHDPAGTHVMTLDRPFKCGAYCPAWLDFCQQQATLFNGTDTEDPSAILARTQQPCCGGLFTPTVNVYSGQSEEKFGTIEGPTCCFGGLTEMCCDQPFPISTESGKEGDIGKIVKEKPEDFSQAMKEIMTDSDLFTLTFDAQIEPEKKLALMSSLLLLDFMFFEQNQPWEFDAAGPSCSVTCCNCYMCGLLSPCKCKCGGGGGGDEE